MKRNREAEKNERHNEEGSRKNMIRVIGYVRESTPRQAKEGFNLEEQQRWIRKYVDLRYSEEKTEFTMLVEAGRSASTLERPQLKRLLEMIKDEYEKKIVIIHNLDRLSRNVADMNKLIEQFNKYNVELVSLQEDIDTTQPQGRMFIQLIVLIAQWEEETIIDRTRRGVWESMNQGNFAKPVVPHGYEWAPGERHKKLVVNELEAEFVRETFEYIASGEYRPCTLAKYYNSIKRLGRSNWHYDYIVGIIRNEIYYGTFRIYGKHVDNHTPAIVPKDLWEKANKVLDANRLVFKKYLFKDKVICEKCGSLMEHTSTTKSNGTVYLYYKCSKCRKTIGEKAILKHEEETLNNLYTDVAYSAEIRRLRDKEDNARREINQLLRNMILHDLDREYALQMIETYTARKEEYHKQADELEEMASFISFGTLTPEEKNRIVETYIENVMVDFENDHITFQYTDMYSGSNKS